MDEKEVEKVEAQIAEALAEAKSEQPAEPVNTGQAEQPNTESSTEEVTTSDAGLFLSANEETSEPAEAGETVLNEPAEEPVVQIKENAVPVHVPEVIGERDWESEWRELAQAHPEVVGKPLPDDIYQACMQSDQSPLRVYESMMLSRQAAEIDSLKREIETLKQNAESASRAPVSAVTGGGAGSEPEDAFVKAFWSY